MKKQNIDDQATICTTLPVASVKGSVSVISGGCGNGKTTAVLNLAKNPDFLNGGKMLFLTTRSADFRKLKAKTAGLSETLTISTLQALERRCEAANEDIAKYINRFSCVAVDEAHYFNTDGSFSRTSVLSFNALKSFADGINSGNGKTLLLISATPEGLTADFDAKELRLPYSVSHIKRVLFVSPERYVHSAVWMILKAKRKGEKGIVFCKKKAEMNRIAELLKSEGQADTISLYSAKRKPLEPNASGEYEIPPGKTAILSTSVLAFGIDFWEKGIKFIMTNEVDPLLAVQELGRKRCVSGEQIDLIIADHPTYSLVHTYAPAIRQLKEAELFMRDPATYISAYAEGGAWSVQSIDFNHCLYTDRSLKGNRLWNPPYVLYCKRLLNYILSLTQGSETWRSLILTRLGFTSVEAAPVVDYQKLVDADVNELLESLSRLPDPIASEWKPIGIALQVPAKTVEASGKTYSYGSTLSRPSALAPLIEKYGYQALPPKKKRINGKSTRIYPIKKI